MPGVASLSANSTKSSTVYFAERQPLHCPKRLTATIPSQTLTSSILWFSSH